MKSGTKRDKYVNIHVQNVLQKMFPNNVLNKDILPPLQSLHIYVYTIAIPVCNSTVYILVKKNYCNHQLYLFHTVFCDKGQLKNLQ